MYSDQKLKLKILFYLIKSSIAKKLYFILISLYFWYIICMQKENNKEFLSILMNLDLDD